MGQLVFVTNSAAGGLHPSSVRLLVGTGPLLTSDDVLLVDASAGLASVLLMPASDSSKRYAIKKVDGVLSNFVRVTPDGSELIEGVAFVDLVAPGDSIDIIPYGGDWYIL